MSIGIIVPANLKYAPYVQYYLDVLKDNNLQYYIMCWNKAGLESEDVQFSFDYEAKDCDRKRIFFGYFKFISACKKHIKKNKITKLIILTAAPAFFMGSAYLRKFSGNYILDIRDDTPLRKRFPGVFADICAMAKNVIVSSKLFDEWIPCETHICHNADVKQIVNNLDLPVKQGNKKPIVITFAGMMIEASMNIEMLRSIGADERFAFQFIGRTSPGKERIETFVREQGLTNVVFEGVYNKDDIYDIYRERADLVNIIRARTLVNRNALPNKLYDAVISGVPVLVFAHNKAIADYVKMYNLGIVLEEDLPNLGDKVCEALEVFDYQAYEQGRRRFLMAVCKDMDNFHSIVKSFSQQ